VQRIQLLLVRWIARVSRNAPCDGLAEPRPGEQQQPSDADDYEWDRHDEDFGNALKDLEVHGPLDEAGASKVQVVTVGRILRPSLGYRIKILAPERHWDPVRPWAGLYR
jgi:hypothetical protein